ADSRVQSTETILLGVHIGDGDCEWGIFFHLSGRLSRTWGILLHLSGRLSRTLLHLGDRLGRTWSRGVTVYDRREDTEQRECATQEHEGAHNHDQDNGPHGKATLLLRLVHVALCHDSSFNFAWLFST